MPKPLILDYFDFDDIKHEKYMNNKKETFSLKCKYCPKEIRAAILRPSRRRLSDRLLEMLLFLKCNWHLFQNDIKL
jgi:hypothetical protein